MGQGSSRGRRHVGECCVCFDEVARGVVCGTREGHFLCAVCAPREVQRVLQALQEPGPLQQFRARGGRIKCVVDGCEAPYRDELILPLLPPSTAQAYRREQADAAEAPRAGNLQSEEAATAEFLKRHYRNAVQCPRCAAGPVIPEHCADLQAHHNQAMERGGRISNACPACGFFSANRADWVAWDGHMRGVSRTAAATNVSSAWAPASSGRMEGLSGEQQEKVTALMRVAAIEDVVFARDLLQEHNWQLETSVNTYFDRLQRNGPARPCPWTAKACLISLLVLALLLFLDAGTVLTFLGHLLAWVWNFSVDVTAWSVQTLKAVCVPAVDMLFEAAQTVLTFLGNLLAWVWNFAADVTAWSVQTLKTACVLEGHLLAWVWNFSVDVTTWSVQTLKTACVLGGHLLAWVWNCWLSRWGGHLALCPAGTLGGKFWGCSPCGPGSWSDEGSTACSCNKGWTAAGVTGGSMCAKCPASTFKAVRGPSGCQACPRGSVSPEGSEAVSQCVSCPAGTFAGNSGSCEQCDPGSWSDEGSSACSCNKGWTAVGGTGVSMCTKCPPNTFKAVRGHSGCQACPRGSVSPEGSEAGRQCVPCPAGTFAGQAGSCEPCGVGSWSDEGSTACSCNKGWTSAGGTGVSMCIKCPVNTFKAVRGPSGCQACPRGLVSPEGSGAVLQCVPCPAGTFAGQAGSCEPCGVGSWSDEGSTACSCNKGWTAAGVTGASMCIKCPTNTFKAVRGHSGCQACPFGFASKEGSEELMECAPEGVISGLTGGVVLMLKGIGVLEEVPRERRWRQQMTSALPEHAHAHVSSALAHVSARVQDAMGDIYSRVTRAVLDLFASLSEFYGASARHEQADASVCSSEKTLKAWLVQQDEYNAWRQAVSAVRGGRGWNRAPECAQMKKSARRVLLILHPDKLQRIHPTCAQGRGALLAADFNAEYDTQKRLCAGR